MGVIEAIAVEVAVEALRALRRQVGSRRNCRRVCVKSRDDDNGAIQYSSSDRAGYRSILDHSDDSVSISTHVLSRPESVAICQHFQVKAPSFLSDCLSASLMLSRTICFQSMGPDVGCTQRDGKVASGRNKFSVKCGKKRP